LSPGRTYTVVGAALGRRGGDRHEDVQGAEPRQHHRHGRRQGAGVLGLEEIPRPAFNFPGIWYGLGNGLSLHIILNDELVRPAVERETILARYGHFALWTEDADATAKRIEELGLPCRDVVSGPTGLRQVFVKDPDGNMVEFIGPTASKEAVRRMESPATA
jgi:catechol 2,3-dioxygenase-like lactoylglutathione lyase family enzyme